MLPFLLRWPRLALLIPGILTTQWDETTWPPARAELRRVLVEMRRQAGAGAMVELGRRANLIVASALKVKVGDLVD